MGQRVRIRAGSSSSVVGVGCVWEATVSFQEASKTEYSLFSLSASMSLNLLLTCNASFLPICVCLRKRPEMGRDLSWGRVWERLAGLARLAGLEVMLATARGKGTWRWEGRWESL